MREKKKLGGDRKSKEIKSKAQNEPLIPTADNKGP